MPLYSPILTLLCIFGQTELANIVVKLNSKKCEMNICFPIQLFFGFFYSPAPQGITGIPYFCMYKEDWMMMSTAGSKRDKDILYIKDKSKFS